jgi:hypothetical protein
MFASCAKPAHISLPCMQREQLYSSLPLARVKQQSFFCMLRLCRSMQKNKKIKIKEHLQLYKYKPLLPKISPTTKHF